MGYRSGDETVEVECRVEAESFGDYQRGGKNFGAYLIQPTSIGPDECWIPKSQIVHRHELGGGLWLFTITQWIANKNGLV